MPAMSACFLGLGWTDRILARSNSFNIDVLSSFTRYFTCLFIKYTYCFHFTCSCRMDWRDPVPGWRQCWRESDDLHGHEGCLLWDPDPGWDHGCLPCGLGEVHPLPCTYPGSDGPPASCGDHDEVPGRWVLIPWYVRVSQNILGMLHLLSSITFFYIYRYMYLKSDSVKINILWEKNMHKYFHVHVQVSHIYLCL